MIAIGFEHDGFLDSSDWRTDCLQSDRGADFTGKQPANERARTIGLVAAKHRIGKLGSAADTVGRFAELILADGFEHLPIDYRHTLRAGSHSQPHRDPFDRILAAQGELDHLTLLTQDAAFEAFGMQLLWS